MKTKTFFFILLWAFSQLQLGAQVSFLKEVLQANGNSIDAFSYSELATDQTGFSFIITSDLPGTDQAAIVVELNLQGNIESVNTIEHSGFDFSIPVSFDRNGYDQAMILRETLDSIQLMLVCINNQTNNLWGKRLSLNQLPLADLGFTSTGNIVTTYYHDYILTTNISPPKLGVASVETTTGNSLFENYYTLSSPITSDTYRTIEVEGNPNGTISILGIAGNSNEPNYFILNLDNNGSIIQSAGINNPDYKLNKINASPTGDLFITGRYLAYPDLGNAGYTCFIAKLNPNLELIWAKEIDIENFNCSAPKISISETGDVFFIYSSNGNTPSVLGQISNSGDLIWHKGYNFFASRISAQQLNQPYIISRRKYFPDGSFSNALVIAATDAQGNIDNCPQFSSCLNFTDFDFQLKPWQWQIESGAALTDISIEISSINLSSGFYCGMQNPPDPYFEITDSICVESCLEPTFFSNENASLINWTITGPGIDTIISDTSFLFCFDVPGDYILEQEVWFLGCSEYHQQTLTVLPELIPIFNTSGFICEDPPFELIVSANRPLQEIEWPDGSTGDSFMVFENGQIPVIIRDQYCEQEVSIEIVFLNSLIDESVIILPPDTIICEDKFPFILNIESSFTENFELIGSDQTGSIFELSEAGNYTIFTLIEDCPFYANFNLEVDPCNGFIYLPNSFSPNNDGINDTWKAHGPDIELINLQIFDRWGGLIYSDFNSPIFWDGMNADKLKVNTGIYVFLINYRTIFDNKTYQVSGDVLVLK